MTTSSEQLLREVEDTDLPIFFDQEQNPQAIHMAAFVSRNPNDHDEFLAHWSKIRSDPGVLIRTIVWNGKVVGYILSHCAFGNPEVSYWIGREFWGNGIATRALTDFLQIQQTRPLFAHVAKDNLGSLRVLEKCGFTITEEKKGFAKARGEEIEEVMLQLNALPDAK